MKFFKYSLILTSLVISQSGIAQKQWCATDEHYQYLLDHATPREAEQMERQREAMFEYAQSNQAESGTVYTIPVVVHVIHHQCVGNISKAQIEDGIRILNEDFRRMNSDTGSTRSIFQPFAADVEVEFKLATRDPNGNCTEGINRISSPLSYDKRDEVKALSRWPSNKYMNVWIVNSIASSSGTGTTLGYAQFPGGGSWNTYGIVVRNSAWGSIGTSNSDGRTVTHEIGHALGLYHTFQSGCGNNCSSSGDRICDTPPTQQATWGCSTTQNTCSNDQTGSGSVFSSNVVDQVENYMSYDDCQNMFTLEQTDLMRGSLGFFSNLINLVSPANLTATGTSPGFIAGTCTPKADFCQGEITICEGQTVTFADNSYNGPATSRTWSFPGGTPSTSTDSVITITYLTAGDFDVTLTVTNSNGTDTRTATDLVSIQSSQADFSNWRYYEDFEDPIHFSNYWRIEGDEGKSWELSDNAAYSGERSAFLFNYITGVDGWTDELITPSFDLSSVVSPQFVFQVAFARKSASNTDLLKLYYSTDCGSTWSIINGYSAANMQSISEFAFNDFVPADASEWKEMKSAIPGFVQTNHNVSFKFEFVSGGGNNIFIDDMRIESLTGIDDEFNQVNLLVFPNPASEVVSVIWNDEKGKNRTVILSDVSGRELVRQPLYSGNRTDLNVADFPKGLYLIQVENTGVVRKLIVR